MIITAVIGSYRKGNTYDVVRQIETRMNQLGEVDFRYLFLSDVNLSPCRGCFLCISRGEALCPLRDDFAQIRAQLLESDGVIFASPNYACGVTSQMRRLIERFAYIGHRPEFFGRAMLTVATSGGPVGINVALKDLSYFAGGGFTPVGQLGLATPPTVQSDKEKRSVERKINDCAKKLYAAVAYPKPFRPSFGGMIQYAAFRGMYRKNPALGNAEFPADMAYWAEKGWLDAKTAYFCAGRIGPLKRFVGWLFEQLIGLFAKDMRAASLAKKDAKNG